MEEATETALRLRFDAALKDQCDLLSHSRSKDRREEIAMS